MVELKTKENDASVDDFIDAIQDEGRRAECRRLQGLMTEISGKPGRMWGDSMVGFGKYHYTYASGHGGAWFMIGFAPRKKQLTIYMLSGFERFADDMKALGKFSNAKSCLYVKRLDDIDETVLSKILQSSIAYMKEHYEVEA